MMSKGVYVVVFDGFADWEPAHALAELRRVAKREIVTVGFEARPVISMGGLRVLPDRALAEVIPEAPGLLILPGGEVWAAGNYPQAQLAELLHRLNASGTPIAAICGATIALARAGLLNDRRHTSTAPEDLHAVGAEYRGAVHYLPALAVTDRDVITASGLGSVEFAREVFSALHVFSDSDEALWFDMYKHGRLPGTAV
jgi:putative intracellular protease/amidase